MKDWNVYLDFHITMEEGTSLFKAHTTCSVYSPELGEAIVVGEATIHMFDPRKTSYEDVCGEAAILSYHLSRAINNLERFCDIENIEGFIAVMQSFTIYDGWHYQGLEEAFFAKLLEQFSYFNVELIAFSPLEVHTSHTSDLLNKWDITYIEYGNGNPLWYKYLSHSKVPSE